MNADRDPPPQEPARRRFGLVRWFQPETLIGRVRQERAMRAGELRRLPTVFSSLDEQPSVLGGHA